jgi:heme-degrading monooxygenase HmoA
MYTRRTTFPVKQDASDQATEIAQRYGKILQGLPGHVSTVMFLAGETIYSITTWDTEEHAEAVQSIRDDAQRDLGDLLTGAPSTAIVETIVHDIS